MSQPNASVESLFDVLSRAVREQLSQERSERVTVSWSGDAESGDAEATTSTDRIWWSWVLSIDSASRMLLGAPLATWSELCGLGEDVSPEALRDACLARFTPAIEQAAQSRFGSEVTCMGEDSSETPPPEWTSVQLSIELESGTKVFIQVRVNPDLELALGASDDSATEREEHLISPRTAVTNSADVLMDVEMPVSVSLGRAKMRLKNLLHLTNGSVVELDQELSDEVEIRVSNCIIAYGEVVAVDGNYAVRIKRMAPARINPDLRGILPEKAA